MSIPVQRVGQRGLPPWLEPHARVRGLAGLVDVTLLRAEATAEEIDRLCETAAEVSAGYVCVNGAWIRHCVRRLRSTATRVVAVVDFPLGAGTTMIKAAEARLAVLDGAAEIDMVMPLGLAKGGEWDAVREDVGVVVGAANGRPVKVILESAALTPEEIVRGCEAAAEGGASFVKTSTGFHPAGGATIAAVRLMRQTVGMSLGVKASGGIRTLETAVRMLAAGADRIGASNLAMLGKGTTAVSSSLEALLSSID
ncbi:MAG: deoxyribose-phosphate aldolase [Gemmatimonadota bacterium]